MEIPNHNREPTPATTDAPDTLGSTDSPGTTGTAGTTDTATEPDHSTAKWWTLTAVCLGVFMLLLDVTIVNVALPDIQSSLGASFSDLQWVIDAYALTLAALLLTTGSLADQFGRRRLYLIGLAVFTCASALCGMAQSPLMLELSRGAQGIGGAIMFSVSLALLANAFRGKDRGVAFAVWGALAGIAVAVGPVVGGVLVSGLSWRWIFFVNLPVGVAALILTALKVTESRDQRSARPDWAGFVLFSAALSFLVYALIESGRTSFTDTAVIVCFMAAAVLLTAFVLVERHTRHPMFDLGLFRLPTFVGGDIAAFGMSAGMFSMLLYLVLYLQDVLGYSALQTGLRLLLVSGGVLVASAVSGRLSVKVPVRILIGPGLLLIGLGLMLMRGLDASSSWTHLIPGLVIGGIGVGLVNPPLASTAVGVVPPRQAGMASGINSTFRQIGIATGIALLGALFSGRLTTAVSTLSARTPLAAHSSEISSALRNGGAARLFTTTPPQQRAALGVIVRGSFTTALNEILLVGAITCFIAGVLAFALIRGKDFVASGPEAPTR